MYHCDSEQETEVYMNFSVDLSSRFNVSSLSTLPKSAQEVVIDKTVLQ
jgi:hypothetical protein